MTGESNPTVTHTAGPRPLLYHLHSAIQLRRFLMAYSVLTEVQIDTLHHRDQDLARDHRHVNISVLDDHNLRVS